MCRRNAARTGISLGSLQSFYDFIQIHNNLKCPIISLTPDNNTYLSWRGEKSRLFSIHFLPGEGVRFVSSSQMICTLKKRIDFLVEQLTIL